MKAVYRRIVDEGHTLGMHSYSNSYSTIYSSSDSFEKDVTKLNAYLKKVTGEKSQYYRFPGGSNNEISNVDMSEFIHVLNEKRLHILIGMYLLVIQLRIIPCRILLQM